MPGYEEQIALLRPLATRADLDRIFPREKFKEHQSGRALGLATYYGEQANNDPRGVATNNVLESMAVEAPFPAMFDFYGFSIGMDLPSAGAAMAKIGMRETASGPGFQRFEGITPEGYEVELLFRETLTQIRLSQPGHSAIKEQRRTFWLARSEAEEAARKRANAWKHITGDDDQMLMEWAAHCKPWNDSSESAFVRFARWLQSASSDERHAAALICNWDYGLAPLLWISRRPDCDIATALLIFFGCSPEYYLQFCGNRERVKSQTSSLETFDMMMAIKSRLEAGFYTRSEIFFDAADADQIIRRHNPTDEHLSSVLPNNLKTRYEGRKITRENKFGGLQIPPFGIA